MIRKVLIFVFLFGLLSSCTHDEGYGGQATIKGKVYGKNYNSNAVLVSEGYVGGFKVYISKHGQTNYFDSVDSAYDGTFKFKYLQKGTYDIWVYGDCDYCQWDQVFVLKTIKIATKKATMETEDFVITF